MLGKLLKYDNREMAHTFVPFFIVIIALALVNNIFIHTEWIYGIIGGSTIIFALFIALAVTALVMVVNQFYKNVLGDQGYLTNTLPVSVDSIICSKLICAMIWFILSTLVAVLTACIMAIGFNSVSDLAGLWNDFVQSFHGLWTELVSKYGTGSIIGGGILFVLTMITGFMQEILHIYFSMTCSQLGFLAKNRVASSFVVYVVSNIVLSVITAAVMVPAAYLSENILTAMPTATAFIVSRIASLVFVNVLNVGFYFATRYILKNKLNLE